MNDVSVLDKVMANPKIKNLGLKKEVISSILNIYNEITFHSLLENGHIDLDNGMSIDIVKISDRIHVLRGITYKSHRKYKLKLSMEEYVYKRIEDYYDKLQEEIL